LFLLSVIIWELFGTLGKQFGVVLCKEMMGSLLKLVQHPKVAAVVAVATLLIGQKTTAPTTTAHDSK
jgi:hypothetical protein